MTYSVEFSRGFANSEASLTRTLLIPMPDSMLFVHSSNWP